jgi:hypothetical protein
MQPKGELGNIMPFHAQGICSLEKCCACKGKNISGRREILHALQIT